MFELLTEQRSFALVNFISAYTYALTCTSGSEDQKRSLQMMIRYNEMIIELEIEIKKM